MTRRQIYHAILYRALINIRTAAEAGDAEQCFLQAYHVHNLPELLGNLRNKARHAYYWTIERPEYMATCKDPRYRSSFAGLWNELAKANGRASKRRRKRQVAPRR